MHTVGCWRRWTKWWRKMAPSLPVLPRHAKIACRALRAAAQIGPSSSFPPLTVDCHGLRARTSLARFLLSNAVHPYMPIHPRTACQDLWRMPSGAPGPTMWIGILVAGCIAGVMAIGGDSAAASSQVEVRILVVECSRPVGIGLQAFPNPMPVGNGVHVGLVVHGTAARHIPIRRGRIWSRSEAIVVLTGIARRPVSARPANRHAVKCPNCLCSSKPTA